MYIEKIEKIEKVDDYKELFEMANYQTRDSGLPYNIWFDEDGKVRFNKHTPRVKVQMADNSLIPVSASAEPEILLKGSQLIEAEKIFHGSEKNEVFDFISRNYNLIISHWNGETSTMTLLCGLKV